MTHRFHNPCNFTMVLALSTLVATIFFGGSLSQVVLAQSPITARVDQSSLPADDQLVLTVTVTGDFLKIPRPDLSRLQGFVVVSSSTSTQVSIVNGQMTSQGVFIYRLQPLQEGVLYIDPITVNIDGQVFETEPIEIEVVSAGMPVQPQPDNFPDTAAPDKLSGQDFFVEAAVDIPNPYLGQQVIYTFRLYQAIQFPPGQPDYTPPAFTDFWSSEILSQPHYSTRDSGRNYSVTEIRTALFPANLGTITIEPASLVIPGGLLNPDLRLETQPITLNVQPLPKGAPEDFSGAVGQFEILSRLNETEVKVNDPVSLVIEISGVGNIQTFGEPTMPDIPDWRIFESQSSTTTETSEGGISGTRTFERLVVPSRAGEQSFAPISFSYYDPDLESYQTISTDPIPVNVIADDSQPALPIIPDVAADQAAVDLIASDIRHIKSVPTALNTSRNFSLAGQMIYLSCLIIPLAAIVTTQLWQTRRRRFQLDRAYARKQRAKRTAQRTLDQARHAGSDGHEAAGRALLGYLSDKLNVPTVGMTTNALLETLSEAGLATALIERVEAILKQVDVARFAPISEESTQSLITDTQNLINDLEKSFNGRR